MGKNNTQVIRDFIHNLYDINVNVGYSYQQLFDKFRDENQYNVLFTYNHPRYAFDRYIRDIKDEGYLNMIKFDNGNRVINIFYKR